MQARAQLHAFHPLTLITVALALSIGWGIRGNFGHEYGAMIPGALAALAVCALSGRDDWRARAPYFAMFGALGWAFGGSISYMKVIGYTHSGVASSVWYGFPALFLIGFLWAGLGGAGTALPAVATRERLTQLFRPLLWIVVVWFCLRAISQPLLEQWESAFDATWSRHQSPLYWFDSDWMEALTALFAVCLYDLWQRATPFGRFGLRLGFGLTLLGFLVAGASLAGGLANTAFVYWLLALSVLLVTLAIAYPGLALKTGIWGGAGFYVQRAFDQLGWSPGIAHVLVQYQADTSRLDTLAAERGMTPEALQADLLTNWPNFAMDHTQHLGWVVGALIGAVLYFRARGRFPHGSSLFIYMGVGFFAAFLLFPVLLGFGGAGFRMTPPRSDNWAGILGVYIATFLWLYRNRLVPVALASAVCGAIGGLGFAGATFLKLLLVSLGNRNLDLPPETVAAWAHYQNTNWHSVLEQTYGFINGIGVAIALFPEILVALVAAAVCMVGISLIASARVVTMPLWNHGPVSATLRPSKWSQS